MPPVCHGIHYSSLLAMQVSAALSSHLSVCLDFEGFTEAVPKLTDKFVASALNMLEVVTKQRNIAELSSRRACSKEVLLMYVQGDNFRGGCLIFMALGCMRFACPNV